MRNRKILRKNLILQVMIPKEMLHQLNPLKLLQERRKLNLMRSRLWRRKARWQLIADFLGLINIRCFKMEKLLTVRHWINLILMPTITSFISFKSFKTLRESYMFGTDGEELVLQVIMLWRVLCQRKMLLKIIKKNIMTRQKRAAIDKLKFDMINRKKKLNRIKGKKNRKNSI